MANSWSESRADFSPCRRYRYKLWRRWGDGPMCNFLMLNPSTADEAKNDPTVERCERRARAAGCYGGLIVTNLFALRATDPAEMKRADDPVGLENNRAIVTAAFDAGGCVICAWGQYGKHMGRGLEVVNLLLEDGAELYCLRLNKDGNPCHPLYVPYSVQPQVWML